MVYVHIKLYILRTRIFSLFCSVFIYAKIQRTNIQTCERIISPEVNNWTSVSRIYYVQYFLPVRFSSGSLAISWLCCTNDSAFYYGGFFAVVKYYKYLTMSKIISIISVIKSSNEHTYRRKSNYSIAKIRTKTLNRFRLSLSKLFRTYRVQRLIEINFW